ncbi:hypothetical protein OS493_028310 [Desmophyllum pertusum]|uniref:Uncharacterized protein n=1 Tax=Desmophyllum pertusum TaxID=174260 RepID=A0A9W9Y991_9CNID|nr:hypothetical protein OS493_028310 [Desmophyllum pertusum]
MFENRLAPPLPVLALTDAEGGRHSIHEPPPLGRARTNRKKNKMSLSGERRSNSSLKKMATCKGEFSKRHKAPGCSTEMAPVSTGPPPRGINIRGTLSAPASSNGSKRGQKESRQTVGAVEFKRPFGI